ncbi:hypothetical protein [Siminovitchia fortis]|uniref:hypothetical protein n=1 Tax=Siminovitchia fortis TaxID=254758 RepID=UPI001642B8D2|nr:hypothetical protein [Siminovitchia fortis]
MKMEKCLVSKMMRKENSGCVVKRIIEMGRKVKLGLIGEGMEREEEGELVMENGWDVGEGYV